MPSLSDRWFRLRNNLLSDAEFQRWAAKFPLTRIVARRRAGAMFDLCAGFVYSQVLLAVVRLHLLEALGDGPLVAAEVASRISLSTEATQRLLDAAASLSLVERRPGSTYGLGVHGASLLGNPSVRAFVEHHALLYRDLADPVALLRGEHAPSEIGRFWSYGAGSASSRRGADVAAYSELMASSLSLIVDDILEAYPLAGHSCLLDVGGGDGAFLEAAAARAPKLRLILFDLPVVASLGRTRLTRAGLSSRTEVVGGDVLADPLPQGADLVSLVRVLHDHDDPAALSILRSVRRALRPGGVLLIAEPMSGTPGAEAMGDAYFGFYLLAMGQGRPRTREHLSDLLTDAGFGGVRSLSTRRPLFCSVLRANPRDCVNLA